MAGRVLRLSARATLDDPELVLRNAETAGAGGNESWARWAEGYRRGEALLLRLRVTLVLELPDGCADAVECVNRAVWVEATGDVPLVEEQVRDVAGKDFAALAAAARGRGVGVTSRDLDHMYVHVSLAEQVEWRLQDAGHRRDASARAGGP